MRKAVIDGNRLSVMMDQLGYANAVRRSLIANVPNFAPDTVRFEENTSCQPDEFIAHRIGLIPFEVLDPEKTELELDVADRDAFSDDICGDGFRATPGVCVMKLQPGQHIKCRIHMKRSTGTEHARFSAVSGAALEYDDPSRVTLRFETTSLAPKEALARALHSLLQDLHNTRYFVETQYAAQVRHE